jgi:hypothetical protein
MKTNHPKKMRGLPASLLNLSLCLCLLGVVFSYQTLLSVFLYADTSMSLADNIKRAGLIRQAINNPNIIKTYSSDDLKVILKKPSVRRNEISVVAWSYHGESCAIDIYFSDEAGAPDHVEFRTLSLNNDVVNQFASSDIRTKDQYCLKDVMDSQGVDTPSSYARQPTPSWTISPYRG